MKGVLIALTAVHPKRSPRSGFVGHARREKCVAAWRAAQRGKRAEGLFFFLSPLCETRRERFSRGARLPPSPLCPKCRCPGGKKEKTGRRVGHEEAGDWLVTQSERESSLRVLPLSGPLESRRVSTQFLEPSRVFLYAVFGHPNVM